MDNQNALAIITKAQSGGALAFAQKGIEGTVPLYKPDVTILDVAPTDFHNLKGKLVAKKETCDRVSDAAGISFVSGNCGVRTEIREDSELGKRTVFIGYAQGKVRLPDGTWRESSVEEYEFDPVLRAKMDAGSKPEGALRLDYMRCARQRAATGARLRVIRQLTGMPTAFESTQIGGGKQLIFSRIVQNTDYILSTPEGRMMAVAAATGVAAQLYGPRPAAAPAALPASQPVERQVGPEAETPGGDDFELEAEGAGAGAPTEDDIREGLVNALRDYLATPNLLSTSAASSVRALIDNPKTPIEGPGSLRAYIEKCKGIYKKQIAEGRRTA